MAMMFKEKLETPENYLENVKKSEIREYLAALSYFTIYLEHYNLKMSII